MKDLLLKIRKLIIDDLLDEAISMIDIKLNSISDYEEAQISGGSGWSWSDRNRQRRKEEGLEGEEQ